VLNLYLSPEATPPAGALARGKRATVPPTPLKFKTSPLVKLIVPLPPSPAGFVELTRPSTMANLICPIGTRTPAVTADTAVAGSPAVAPEEAGDETVAGSPWEAAIVVSLILSAFPSRLPPTAIAACTLLLPRTVPKATAWAVEIGAISHQASRTTIPAATLGLPRLSVIRLPLSPPLALVARNRHSFPSNHY